MILQLQRLAERAGCEIMKAYQAAYQVDYKAPGDPVTSADRAANELLCEGLQASFPGVPIVAEESMPTAFGDYQDAPATFFVDPIDGTREFIQGTGHFVVMIGLCVQGVATVGVVHAPTTGETWFGRRDGHAFHAAQGRSPERIQVGGCDDPASALVLISRANLSEPSQQAASIGARKVQALGSAGLKGVWVASGRADAYYSPGPAGMRWDACAIDALIHAAGGTLTNTRGEALNYNARSLSNRGGLLAANPRLHARLVAGLAGRDVGRFDPQALTD